MKEDEIKKSRNKAVTLELNLGENDRLMEMVSRSSGLFCITKKKILRYRSPDELDPRLEHSSVPWEQSLILPLGSTNPIVSRTVIQTLRITETLFPKQSEKYQLLSDVSWEVMNSLVSLQFIKDRLEQQINEIVDLVSKDLEKYTQGESPKPLPTVAYYDIEFRSFVNETKRCLDAISDLFPILTDLKFGDSHFSYKEKFGRGHFHKAQLWASALNQDLLAQMLNSDQAWIGPWIAIRVAIEHPKKDKFVETLNFSLEPDRKVRLPTWRFIHPDYDMWRPQNLLEVFGLCINNLLKFYEDLQIILLEKHLPNLPSIIEFVPQEKRDLDIPIRYKLFTIANGSR